MDDTHHYSVVPAYYRNTARRCVIVDIDKTLCLTNEYPYLGAMNVKLVEVLRKLDYHGMNIIASTCRLNPAIVGGAEEAEWHREQIQRLLDDWGLDFVTLSDNIKPYATLTIDDKSSSYQPFIDLFERMDIFLEERLATDLM
jgi:hypothetical protein